MADQVFSFLKLPQELQYRIYREHFEGAAIVARWSPLRRSAGSLGLIFDPMPSLSIELVCHKTRKDARFIREECWPRIMTITGSQADNLEPTRLDMVFDGLVEGVERYSWLRNRIVEVIVLGVLCRYGSRENCFAWETLLHAMPQLRNFSFSTWKNLSIKNREDARRFLLSVDSGEQDEYILEGIHKFGIGDLPEHLRKSTHSEWSSTLKTAFRFKSIEGLNWYQRVLEVDFQTMTTISRETIVDDVDMLSDVSEGDDVQRAHP